MTDRIFTSEEEIAVEALAKRRGFSELRTYIRALVDQDAQAHHELVLRRPTLDELMAMPPEERDYWLEKAAALAEDLYLNDPELTITADTIDLYDYPDEE